MKKILKSSLVCLVILCSCNNQINQTGQIKQNNVSKVNTKNIIRGKVEFPKTFKVKADFSDISKESTISVVKNNIVLASGLSDEFDNFSIDLGSLSPAQDEIFTLQAVKRIGNNENISINTYLKWNGANWETITTNGIVINEKTTALVIISKLTPSLLSDTQTINVLTDSTINLTGSLTPNKVNEVSNKVILLLKKNKDPMSKIIYKNNDYLIDSNSSVSELITNGYCDYCSFEGVALENSDIDYVEISNSILNKSNFQNSNMFGSNLNNDNFSESNFNNINLENSDIKDSKFNVSILNNVIINYSDIINVEMKNSQLNNTKMSSCNINQLNLSNSQIKSVNLSYSKIVNSDFKYININLTEGENLDLSRSRIYNSDLSYSSLRKLNLSNSHIDNVNISNSDLSYSNISNSYINNSDLSNTNLSNSDLSYSDLQGLDVSTANFSGANMSNVIWIDGSIFSDNKICASGSIGQCN